MRVRQGSALGRLGVWGEGSPGFGVRKEGKREVSRPTHPTRR